MKRNYKFKALGDVQAVMNAALTQTEAAKRLGVNLSTIWRWIKAGKVTPPRHWHTASAAGSAGEAAALLPGQSPDEWASSVRAGRELSATDHRLVDLATEALIVALDKKTHSSTRLQAMGRFQLLVRQLRLEAGPVADQVPTPTRAPAPRRTGTDPRALLMAVK